MHISVCSDQLSVHFHMPELGKGRGKSKGKIDHNKTREIKKKVGEWKKEWGQ